MSEPWSKSASSSAKPSDMGKDMNTSSGCPRSTSPFGMLLSTFLPISRRRAGHYLMFPLGPEIDLEDGIAEY